MYPLTQILNILHSLTDFITSSWYWSYVAHTWQQFGHVAKFTKHTKTLKKLWALHINVIAPPYHSFVPRDIGRARDIASSSFMNSTIPLPPLDLASSAGEPSSDAPPESATCTASDAPYLSERQRSWQWLQAAQRSHNNGHIQVAVGSPDPHDQG